MIFLGRSLIPGTSFRLLPSRKVNASRFPPPFQFSYKSGLPRVYLRVLLARLLWSTAEIVARRICSKSRAYQVERSEKGGGWVRSRCKCKDSDAWIRTVNLSRADVEAAIAARDPETVLAARSRFVSRSRREAARVWGRRRSAAVVQAARAGRRGRRAGAGVQSGDRFSTSRFRCSIGLRGSSSSACSPSRGGEGAAGAATDLEVQLIRQEVKAAAGWHDASDRAAERAGGMPPAWTVAEVVARLGFAEVQRRTAVVVRTIRSGRLNGGRLAWIGHGAAYWSAALGAVLLRWGRPVQDAVCWGCRRPLGRPWVRLAVVGRDGSRLGGADYCPGCGLRLAADFEVRRKLGSRRGAEVLEVGGRAGRAAVAEGVGDLPEVGSLAGEAVGGGSPKGAVSLPGVSAGPIDADVLGMLPHEAGKAPDGQGGPAAFVGENVLGIETMAAVHRAFPGRQIEDHAFGQVVPARSASLRARNPDSMSGPVNAGPGQAACLDPAKGAKIRQNGQEARPIVSLCTQGADRVRCQRTGSDRPGLAACVFRCGAFRASRCCPESADRLGYPDRQIRS